jgi:hypothetical protein
MASGGALPYAGVKDNLAVIAGIVLGELSLESPRPLAAEGPQGQLCVEVVMAFVRRCTLPLQERPTMHQIHAEMKAWIERETNAEEERRRETQRQQQQQQQLQQQQQQQPEAEAVAIPLQHPPQADAEPLYHSPPTLDDPSLLRPLFS